MNYESHYDILFATSYINEKEEHNNQTESANFLTFAASAVASSPPVPDVLAGAAPLLPVL